MYQKIKILKIQKEKIMQHIHFHYYQSTNQKCRSRDPTYAPVENRKIIFKIKQCIQVPGVKHKHCGSISARLWVKLTADLPPLHHPG